MATTVIRPTSSTHQRQIREESLQPQEVDSATITEVPNPESDEPSNPEQPNPGTPNPGGPGGDPEDPDDDDDDNDDDEQDVEEEVTAKMLRRALVNISRAIKPATSEPKIKVRNPDPFDGNSPEKLRIFLFQCDVVFQAQPKAYASHQAKIFFAISFLKGMAMEYFEPYITEKGRDSTVKYDFLEDWDAFHQHINNQFGSYNPEQDNEDALYNMTFPEDGNAAKFFVEFARYRSRVALGDRGYHLLARQALPKRITDRLSTCGMPTDTYDQLRLAALKIDNDYWKRKQEDAASRKKYTALQARYSKNEKSNSNSNNNTPNSSTNSNNGKSENNKKKDKGKGSSSSNNNSSAGSQAPTERPAHLGPDNKLTATERQRRMDKGLCLVCGKEGHMRNSCPSAKPKSSSETKTDANPSGSASSTPKN